MNERNIVSPQEETNLKRKRSVDRLSHTRTVAACDACRASKTRCNSARPACAQCTKRGRTCVYPDTDPSSRFEEWGQKILTAIEVQNRQLSTLMDLTKNAQQSQQLIRPLQFPYLYDERLETLSRKDVPYTPITAGDVILDWSVFPEKKPHKTFPPSAYMAKPIPFAYEEKSIPSPERVSALRNIFITAIQDKAPITDADEIDSYIAEAQRTNFEPSPKTCVVLLVLAIGALWGSYPEDERRVVSPGEPNIYTIAVPESRLKESCMYFSMARPLMQVVFEDTSLLSAFCFCLFGVWHQYNIDPIQAWKMFRTSAMLWEAYAMKQAQSTIPRSEKEKSLEQRLYWTLLKIEGEMRHELPDLPTSTLQESTYPFSVPMFPIDEDAGQSSQAQSAPSLSHYFFLAEVSLRRLLNRTRHAVAGLSKTVDSVSAAEIDKTLGQLRGQLQQWLDCLPAALRFNVPPDSWPPPVENELIKLLRERYLEISELLCRAYLYICLHGGSRLTTDQVRHFGAEATTGLRFNIYRVRTEKPFWRHGGSWIACRVRFNHALCLIAAARGKELGIASTLCLDLPPDWLECVSLVQQRLRVWSDQGGGIAEMAGLLDWLMSTPT